MAKKKNAKEVNMDEIRSIIDPLLPPVVEVVDDLPNPKLKEMLENFDNIDYAPPQYKLVCFMGEREAFEKMVQDLINDGWSVNGGISIAIPSSEYSASIVYCQSLLKYM